MVTSGGLDSSLVTALAAESGRPDTFNVAYTGVWPGDERRFARQVAERAGTRHHQVELDPATLPALLPEVVWHLGQPNADPITVSTYALFGAVRDAGFKVALAGDAADEVFGGYDRMRAAVETAAAGRDWLPSYVDSLAVAPAADRWRLYTPDYAAEVRAAPDRLAEQVLAAGAGTVLDRVSAFELRYRLPAYHLRRVDHLSMANAVEVRLPFCQGTVVDLGRALPLGSRISGGRVKRALYAAARGLLPPAVLDRPKQPFTLPVGAMLRPGWPVWDYARDMLTADRLRAAGQVDPGAVDALFARHANAPDDTVALTLWALLVHEVWREQFGLASVRARAELAAAS